MVVWRICKRKWAATAFNGTGAAENPGRWNSENRRMVYCAQSRALAALEVLVNTPAKRTLRHARFVVIPVDIPERLIAPPPKLPRQWDRIPPGPATRRLGDAFLGAARLPAMRVPSAAVRGEFCYVLNPLHPDFAKLSIGVPEAFEFDSRAV